METSTKKANSQKALTIVGIVLCVVFGFMLICNIFIIVQGTLFPERPPQVLGVTPLVVLSGSMHGDAPDHIESGDLIFVVPVDPQDLEVGDVITFIVNEDLVVGTHRVVRVDAENQRFYTKGDANDIEDQNPVHFNNVIGVPQFSIPKLGYVSDFVQNPPGLYITIGVGIILILAVFLPDMIGKKKEDESEEVVAAQTEIDTAAEENEKLKAEIAQLRAEMESKKSD